MITYHSVLICVKHKFHGYNQRRYRRNLEYGMNFWPTKLFFNLFLTVLPNALLKTRHQNELQQQQQTPLLCAQSLRQEVDRSINFIRILKNSIKIIDNALPPPLSLSPFLSLSLTLSLSLILTHYHHHHHHRGSREEQR